MADQQVTDSKLYALEIVNNKQHPITVSIDSIYTRTGSTGLTRKEAIDLIAYYHRQNLHKNSTIKCYSTI